MSNAIETPTRITIPVSGMTCAACQARVQRALARQPGVADAAVNLMTNYATVAYDPSRTSPEALVDTIKSTGYGASLPTPGAHSLLPAPSLPPVRLPLLKELVSLPRSSTPCQRGTSEPCLPGS